MAVALPTSPAEVAPLLIDDPLGFVMYAYPWGEPGPLQDESGPDSWQVETLEHIRDCLVDPAQAGAIRFAIASGHGIGKGALSAWIIQWYSTTRPRPQIVVTANTQSQLQSKTWREVSKWHQLSRFRGMFTWSKTRYSRNGADDTWFASALPWNDSKPEAFQGTHDKYVLILKDEASAIPDVIWDAVEGSLTTPQVIVGAFGNPTRATGRFKELFPGGRFAHRWWTRQIDSRTCKKTDKAQLAQWIADYGEESDFVRVRVLGQFPRQAVGQFISEATIAAAIARAPTVDPLQPTVIGVDVARFGDDRSVILVREGASIAEVRIYREIDTVRLSGYVCEVANAYREQEPTVCIDGVGVGAGVVDVCRARGYRVEEVLNGTKPQDPLHYENLRAESWDLMRQWLETRACLDSTAKYYVELRADLLAPEYAYDVQYRLQLERKQHMKDRGLASPDLGDALALTFAVPIAPRRMPPAPAVTPYALGVPEHLAWMAR